jgi:hypothetical protein
VKVDKEFPPVFHISERKSGTPICEAKDIVSFEENGVYDRSRGIRGNIPSIQEFPSPILCTSIPLAKLQEEALHLLIPSAL